MTIDLGFAWLRFPPGDGLPDAEEIGVIDVPGHRDFIENMLAGVGGIDAALFVVAADEGVMPQTREHLAILDLLQVQSGVVALTKTDLVDDPDWLDLVEEEVRQVLEGTVLAEAPIVRVSARAGQGVAELVSALRRTLSTRPPRPDLGRPRLPVDRVFTIAGFGTVVTGTLLDGELRVGDEVVVLPGSVRGRVRGLQSHQRKTDIALPGGRTAVNISGVDVDQLARGDVVTQPGSYRPTRRLDVQTKLVAGVSQPLKHNQEVKFFLGAAEVMARVRLLGTESLSAGETGWLQLELRDPVVAMRGDRYILRRPSPGETLGGGIVVEAHPRGRYKRFSQEVLDQLASLSTGDPADVLLQAALALGAAPLGQVLAQAGLPAEAGAETAAHMLTEGLLVPLEPGGPGENRLVAARAYWERLSGRMLDDVGSYHRRHPLRRGMPKEELRSRLKVPPRVFAASLSKLAEAGRLVDAGVLVHESAHKIQFNARQQDQVDSLLQRFADHPYDPPTIKECHDEVGEELLAALIDLDRLVQVSPEVVFRREDFERMLAEVRDWIGQHGSLSVAEFRDRFRTSRRYALALLEHLDEIGVTYRDGDVRRVR